MRRKLFNVAAVLSLMLCVATAALWVRSYVANEWFVYQRTEPVNRLYWHIAFVSNISKHGSSITCQTPPSGALHRGSTEAFAIRLVVHLQNLSCQLTRLPPDEYLARTKGSFAEFA